FQQLHALSEVFEMMRTLDPLHATNVVIRRFAIVVESEESLVLVAQMLRSHTTIQDVEINGLGSFAASDVAAALATSEHITSVSLPNLSVNDAAFQAIMKVVNNREQLFVASNNARLDDIAVAKEAKNDALVEHLTAAPAKHLLLKIDQLDLSQSSLEESKSFEMIRGQAMSSINLSGCSFVQDVHVGEILRGCPQLESIDLSNCPQLTNDWVSYINASKSIRKVNLLGSSGMGKLNFFFVETLVTNLAGVSQLDSPALKSLPVPITHLSLVSFSCPVLEEVTFRGLSLCDRELRMIADSSPSLAKVHFIKCRLQGSEFFFRVLRSLTDLALHACKSITDQEVTCLCSQLRALDLTDSYCLTDKSMKYLAERCTQLTHLTLKRCANITDQGLQCFAQHASLEYLNVLGTKKVTIVGLHRVIGTLPSLTRVVHETLVSATIAVDRDDAEEAEKFILNSQQADLFARRDGAELNYLASTSPRRNGGRETTVVGTGANFTPLTPRPPTASSMTSPKAIQAQQQHQQEDDEAVAGKATSTPSLIAASSISEVAATAAATAPTPNQLQRSPSAAAEEGRQPQADLPELAPGSISAL
ncbi:leucine-rich repeat protein, putative, partial [Bodo saltans]